MGENPDGPPVVLLPERFGRRLRLGPFASARDALKFLCYATAGALGGAVTTPLVWPLIAAGGFAVCVAQVDGRPADEYALTALRWWLLPPGVHPMSARTGARATGRHRLVTLRGGRYAALVRAVGTPVAYLPPAELARRFASFRELLRSMNGPIAFAVGSIPMRPGPVLPRGAPRDGPDRAASAGYSELVVLLCRRRRVRRVDLVVTGPAAGADAVVALETRTTSLVERLEALGVRGTRLGDRALEDAVRRWGWTWRPTPN
jgi:hypothetical protein